MAELIVDVEFENTEDILTWDAPPFICPDGVDQVRADFVHLPRHQLGPCCLWHTVGMGIHASGC